MAFYTMQLSSSVRSPIRNLRPVRGDHQTNTCFVRRSTTPGPVWCNR